MNKNKLSVVCLLLMLAVLPDKQIHASPQTDWYDFPKRSIYNHHGEKIAFMEHSTNCKHSGKTENTNHCTHAIQLHPNKEKPDYPVTPAFLKYLHEQSFLNVTIEETDDVFHVQLKDQTLSREYHLHSDNLPELPGNFNTTENLIKLIAIHPHMLTNFGYEHSYFQPVWRALSMINLSSLRWALSRIGLINSSHEGPFSSSQDEISAITEINLTKDGQWLYLKTEDSYALVIQVVRTIGPPIYYIFDPLEAYLERKFLDTAKPIVNLFDVAALPVHALETIKYSVGTGLNLIHLNVRVAVQQAFFTLHNAFETAMHLNHADPVTFPTPGLIMKIYTAGDVVLECVCSGFVVLEYLKSSGNLYSRGVFLTGLIPPIFHAYQKLIFRSLNPPTSAEKASQSISGHPEHDGL